MKTNIFAFGVALALLLNVGYAQEELLLDDSSSSADDLFGGDFLSDLDSILGETSTETSDSVMEEPMMEDTLDGMITEESSSSSAETLQSSATAGGALPSSADVTLTVLNVSEDNADALQSGAKPGDVLRFEIALNSQTEDVVDYVPTIDVSRILPGVEFTNTGFGVLNGGTLTYPAYSHQAPCSQSFTFFVQIKEDCGSLTSLAVSSTEAGAITVPLNCGLAQTGPAQKGFLIAGIMLLVLALGFGLTSRTKSS